MPELSISSTGENIFRLINEEFERRNISWRNCLSFAADNASVMSGIHKGVVAFVKKQNEDVYVVGCASHLIHLAAEKGSKMLPLSVEDLLVSIYLYLDKSASRQQELKNFQILHDTDIQKILQHVSTRWLSMGICLQRVLNQWEPLHDFFKDKYVKIKRKVMINSNKPHSASKEGASDLKDTSKPGSSKEKSSRHDTNKTENEVTVDFLFPTQKSDGKKRDPPKQKERDATSGEKNVEKIYDMLRSKTMKLYCLFLKSNIDVFDVANKVLQNDKPCIHILHNVLIDLFQKLLCRFVKAGVIKNAKSVLAVDFEFRENQKTDENLVLGSEAKLFVEKYGDVLNLKSFFCAVRNYYVTVCTYMLKKFPFGDEVLLNAEIANIDKRSDLNYSAVKYFLTRFKCLSEKFSEKQDEIEMELLMFQIDAIPDTILQEERIDRAWSLIGELKNTPGDLKYRQLSQIMLSILTIFHSNVECERIFSVVTKNKTKYRPNMGNNTLNAIITRKTFMSSMQMHSHDSPLSTELLKKCKSATYNVLNE